MQNDFTSVLVTQSIATQSQALFAAIKSIARLGVCEYSSTTGQYFTLSNPTGTSTSLLVMGGSLSTMSVTSTSSFSFAGSTQAILIFDLYYKCTGVTANNMLFFMFVSFVSPTCKFARLNF
jgi:hypothetical protein